MTNVYQSYADQLEQLKQKNSFRFFKNIARYGQHIVLNEQKMLNLSSNDYLGIAQDTELKQRFLEEIPLQFQHLTSSSSRLLTGNFEEYEALETQLSLAFNGRASLVFNSGYHMNLGILPAVADAKTLIISDELIHASMIDGIRLSKAKRARYAHQDFTQLETLIQQAMDDAEVNRIIIVTESVFSMDGDITDLVTLVSLKKKYPKVMLYVDEAHAIGVYGQRGLGCAEQSHCIAEIDFLVGTFGKALASIGGYIICEQVIKDYLINTMRPLIFSTAQAPINMAWTSYVFEHMQHLQSARENLYQLGQMLKQHIITKGYDCPSQSHIVPIIYGDNQVTLDKAKQMQDAGFYVLPIRPPTVPVGTSRIRVCLHADLKWDQLEPLIQHL